MEILKDAVEKNALLELATQVGRAGHQLKSICQNYVALSHPEILTVDNIAGNIEGEARNLKANIFNDKDFKQSSLNIARGSTFLTRITKSDFFKDSDISPETLARIQTLAGLIVQAIKTIETKSIIAQIKHTQNLFGEQLVQLPQLPTLDATALSKFGVAPVALPPGRANVDSKALAEATSEYLGNLAHMTQETLDVYVNNDSLKPIAAKLINLSGGVENEARACLVHARKGPKLDVNGVKKAVENAKLKIADEHKLIDEHKDWVPKVKDTLKSLLEDQTKAINKLGEIAAQA